MQYERVLPYSVNIEDVLTELLEYFEDRADVIDNVNSTGVKPNKEMNFATEIQQALYQIQKAKNANKYLHTSLMDYQKVTFPNRENLDSLANFHNKGGELYDGMPIVFERNYRSELLDCTLKSWQIGSVKMDITGLGKYSESSCMVDLNGKIEKLPFTMLYVKK